MQRYFATYDSNNNITFSPDDIFHMSHVMRMKQGERIEANCDGDLFLVEIESFSPFKFRVVNKVKEEHELNGYIRLLYCLPKGEKTDLVIQKATELGVDEVVLINSTRSVTKINNENKDKKLIRYNKIIKEASEQSKRSKLMKLTDVITFKDLKNYPGDFNFIAYEATKTNLNDLKNIFLNNDLTNKTINVIIGAEGGLTKEEVEIAMNLGYSEISLGNRILRSETASIYILSLISFFLESK
jgi:16S rRNA (uracil1498-N3)-methyltransferase